MDSCCETIAKKIEKEYENVIEEIRTCYNNRCFRACCSLLISQIDRIFQSFSGKQFSEYNINSGKQRGIVNQKIIEDYNINEHDIGRLLLWYSLKETFDVLYEYVDFKNYNKKFDREKINRHCIQHGHSQHEFTNIDCLQLSTVLYTVIQMTNNWDIIHLKSFSNMGMLVEHDQPERSFNFGYPHQVYALPARSLRSLGVAIPPSARKLAAGYRPYGALARMPALGYASGTLRSACAAVGPPRRRQPGGSRRRRGGPIATVPCRRGKEKSWKRGQTPDVGMVPGRKDSGSQPIHL